ncbi:MAG: hypothetical protein RIQ59_1851 [Bacteroidota bacterium]|jgi:hypothetical protein
MKYIKFFSDCLEVLKISIGTYKWIQKIRKNPDKARRKLNYYLYHRNSIKIIDWFLTGTLLLLGLNSLLVFCLIWLKFNLSITGFYLGVIFVLVFTYGPRRVFNKIIEDHSRDVKRINSGLQIV